MIGEYKNSIKSAIGNSYVVIYTTPASKVSVISALAISNTTGNAVQVSVRVRDTSAAVTAYLIKNVPIPGGATLPIDVKVALEANDYIDVICDTSGETVDAVATILENINA